jgi:hypothetical protein
MYTSISSSKIYYSSKKKSTKNFLTRVEKNEDIPIPASPYTIASFFIVRTNKGLSFKKPLL